MYDFIGCLIQRDDDIVFIKNKRGEKPRLVFGIVYSVGNQSIEIEDDDGTSHEVKLSQRSLDAGKMLNAVTIPMREDRKGDTLDCTGHPIFIGDKVAFMEAPSQGFSTSLIIGKVASDRDGEITIQVEGTAYRKYMRKSEEIAVIA